MTGERVAPTQRFTKKTQECPICEGYRELPSGKSERCAGYLSPDGRYAYCTREEYAGTLKPTETAVGPTWRHWLGAGVCRCGQTHGAQENREQEQLTPKRTAWELVFASDMLAGVHIRTDYLNGDGQPAQAKQFKWEQHNGRSSRDMPLYNLPELQAAPKGSTVYLTEGEKACDALRRQGVLAVATVTGAGVTPCDESLRPLVGHDARLWPDHDDGGRQHMDRIAARLVALGGTSRTLGWSDAPVKGDAFDYLAGGGTVEGLAGLLKDDSPKRRSGVIIADVQPEIVHWLWLHRIPLGKLTVLDGDPDNGKSVLSLDLAARVD
jgi:hypothetical protein